MEYSRLFLGLVAPWLAGFFCLRAVETRYNSVVAPNIFRQIAYGFFLGYAGLYGLIAGSHILFNEILFWPVAGTILIIAFTGAIKAHNTGASSTPPPHIGNDWAALSLPLRTTLVLLVLWIIVHLSLVAIEIAYRPVFPWDAWLNWIYRAKAWFLQGTLFPFPSPAEWAANPIGPAYNVAGNNYPTFVPIIALWAASSLGSWSETLVNIPVLLCGIALAMGMYGHCREIGGNYLESTIAAYVLLSIPLVGTHLALGGMADIWVAGFVGLGFVALIRGLIESNRYLVALGLLMAALAIMVKMEGLVWCVAAACLYLLLTRPRPTIATAALIMIMALIAWLTGLTSVELPGLGLVGYVDGVVHVPFKGGYPLMQFELADDYLQNFFSLGSWNILWSLLLLTLPLLWWVEPPRAGRTVICFYLIFMATQVVIFGFTEQGRWAEDSTAINRLPLHFVPALVFCLMLPVIKLRLQQATRNRSPQAARLADRLVPVVMPVMALTIVSAGLIAYLLFTVPPQEESPRLFQPADMAVVVGSGHIENGVRIVDSYRDNIAIVSSGPVDLAAADRALLQIDTGDERTLKAGFFWRPRDKPGNVESLPLEIKGRQYIDLSAVPAWTGHITELGLAFYRDGESRAELRQIALLPKTVESSIRSIWSQWTQSERWSQKSANWIRGGGLAPVIPLPLFAVAYLLVLLVIHRLFVGGFISHPTMLLAYALVVWMALDMRWTTNLIFQADSTMASSPQANAPSYIDTGEDRELAEFVQDAKSLIPDDTASVLVYADEKKQVFQALRAKYHLLPHPAYVHEGDIGSIPAVPVNYVLVINPISLDPVGKNANRKSTTNALQEKFGQKLQVISESDIATMFKTGVSD
jgi:hypothetical protein